ncbi:hypothetical protein HF264_19550 [Rhizobium leguminosarum]|uniref:hypothetical protein n=1 Tax=Rhizobium leguminosarum TaxID=384 RepID=UPI001C918607|nr:hypothetical protein [Rhizobium leguminosarum]MBY2941864.1 hypothetical protein [Rhizobium leguminosarum]
MSAIKNATILARAAYPPVSAWEFKSITTEKLVRDRLSASTIYFVVQRPMLWFDNVEPDHNPMSFDIVDGSGKCIHCVLNVYEALGLREDEIIDVEVSFHRLETSSQRPFRHVAAIRVYRGGEFLAWWSPAKLLFEASTRGLPLKGAGDLDAFIDYDVHYIGQAFDQKVWKRLKAHAKLQDVLTEEDVRGEFHRRPALEVSLITLEIIGIQEQGFDAQSPILLPSPYEPIIHQFDVDPPSDNFAAFYRPWLVAGDPPATNELEAMLIHMFDPKYNEVKFSNYPNIKNGTRSVGYTYADVAITDFPFRLKDAEGNEPLTDAD